MQICKASRSEKREPVEMVQGFKSWSSRCESDSTGPRLTEPVWRPRCCPHTGVSFQLFIQRWTVEQLNFAFHERQIKACLRGPLITTVCFINSTQWLTGTRAALHFSVAVVPHCWQSWLVYLLCEWFVTTFMSTSFLCESRKVCAERGAISFLNTRGQWWQQSWPFRLLFCCAGHRRIQYTTF